MQACSLVWVGTGAQKASLRPGALVPLPSWDMHTGFGQHRVSSHKSPRRVLRCKKPLAVPGRPQLVDAENLGQFNPGPKLFLFFF